MTTTAVDTTLRSFAPPAAVEVIRTVRFGGNVLLVDTASDFADPLAFMVTELATTPARICAMTSFVAARPTSPVGAYTSPCMPMSRWFPGSMSRNLIPGGTALRVHPNAAGQAASVGGGTA